MQVIVELGLEGSYHVDERQGMDVMQRKHFEQYHEKQQQRQKHRSVKSVWCDQGRDGAGHSVTMEEIQAILWRALQDSIGKMQLNHQRQGAGLGTMRNQAQLVLGIFLELLSQEPSS
ncbi:Small Conductance Calcium-Activated Potassium Channel Protein 1 [Manis pentadactyla]|nr:Small Conductance Calcium-Activated Potassium Channel Protein 1 [Manis pentadactyla]